MPAHVPRRVFAAPFIVTVATVAATAVAACASKPPETPHGNPPAPDDSAAPSATTTASAVSSAAPDATDAGEPTVWTSYQQWSLVGDGKSCAVAMHVDCNPGASCNPPRPEAYACPSRVTKYPATIFVNKGSSECKVHIEPDMSCPRGMHCNPPPPHDVVVPCPK